MHHNILDNLLYLLLLALFYLSFRLSFHLSYFFHLSFSFFLSLDVNIQKRSQEEDKWFLQITSTHHKKNKLHCNGGPTKLARRHLRAVDVLRTVARGRKRVRSTRHINHKLRIPELYSIQFYQNPFITTDISPSFTPTICFPSVGIKINPHQYQPKHLLCLWHRNRRADCANASDLEFNWSELSKLDKAFSMLFPTISCTPATCCFKDSNLFLLATSSYSLDKACIVFFNTFLKAFSSADRQFVVVFCE